MRVKVGRMRAGIRQLAAGCFVLATAWPSCAAGEFERLKSRLVRDGFDTEYVRALYNSPQARFLPRVVKFNIRYVESPAAYESFLRAENIQLAESFYRRHRIDLEQAERKYGVDSAVICAIMLIETKCGRDTDSERVFSVFSSIAVSSEDAHVRENHRRLKAEDSGITLGQVRKRAKSRGEWAYRELKTMLKLYESDSAALRELRGSWAGAFGMPQFLPSSYKNFAVSATGGQPDLFDPRDAIVSVANYLKKNGWGESEARRRKAVWRYNHSDLYVETVFKVAEKLKP